VNKFDLIYAGAQKNMGPNPTPPNSTQPLPNKKTHTQQDPTTNKNQQQHNDLPRK